MTRAPFGSVIDDVSFLPDDDHGLALPRGATADSEDARIANLFRAALKAHLEAAFKPTSELRDHHSGISETDRAYSRRVLTAAFGPWRDTRAMLCDACGYHPEALRQRVLRKLAPIIAAEREAEAQHVETEAERRDRLALIDHIEAGGDTFSRRLRRKVDAERDVPALAAE